MAILPSTFEAYQFFHEGTLALSHLENNGIRIDEEYLDRTIIEVGNDIKLRESLLKESPIYRTWKKRFTNPNLDSGLQLTTVLNLLGYSLKEKTDKGKSKVDERALETIDNPFVKSLVECKKLKKVLGTYLKGIRRETINGYLRPSYNLAGGFGEDSKGGAKSYRGSCSDPNFQNMPIRSKTMGKLIRTAFIAPDGYVLAEIDYATIEVRIAACVTKDPVLIDYVKNSPPKDMHRDVACKLFMLPEDEVGKKTTRDAAKNKFVFPQFYGDYYKTCAASIWEMMERGNWKLEKSGILVKDHLASKGITSRGKCDKADNDPPRISSFEHRVKEVEDLFWNDWFKVFTKWKNSSYEEYLKTGELSMPTGFTAKGVYRKNQILNLPIQGPAFHCLLKSIIEIIKQITLKGMKSKVVGQIHDCVLVYIHKSEIQKVLNLIKEVMTKVIKKLWKWIIVPLEIEVDIVPEGLTWNEKEPWTNESGIWKRKE